MSKTLNIQTELLKLLLRDGTVTRPQCVKELGVRPATVQEGINALKQRGLVQEPERTSLRTGRKAPLLTLVPDALWMAGIEVRGGYLHGVVVDAAGTPRATVTRPGNYRFTREDYIEKILNTVNDLRKQCGDQWPRVKGIGFADPGLVDMKRGVSLYAVNLANWSNLAIREELERFCALPAALWPECAVSTHLEYLQRAKSLGDGSLFYLGMGAGVGGGFIQNGRLFTGDQNIAMEVGHIVVKPNGPPCRCGNHGCLEAVVGWRGISQRQYEAASGSVSSNMNIYDFDITDVVKHHATDKLANIIATEVCECIGTALATVVTLLNPTCIVLRGELTGLGDFLVSTIRRVLSASCFPQALENLRIELSTLEPDAVARGAALLMRDQILLENL